MTNGPEWGGTDNSVVATEATTATSSSLKDNGYFFISDPFTASLAQKVVTWILESNFETKRTYDHLTLIINSPGGSVNAGFAIIDAMRGSAIPVHTIGLGEISSCGLLAFMAGKKGHRILTPNTSILSHQWAWGSYGKQHELFARVREYELTTERIMEHYRRCTGLSDELIREKLLPAQDVWLSGVEAKALNLCDDIRDMK